MTDFAHLSGADFRRAKELARPREVRIAVALTAAISALTLVRVLYDVVDTWHDPVSRLPEHLQQQARDEHWTAWLSGAAVLAVLALAAIAGLAVVLARLLWRADAGARWGLTAYGLIGVIGLTRTVGDFHGGMSFYDLALNLAAGVLLVELWAPATSRWIRRFDEG